MLPAALSEKMPGKVILMQALHDHDNGTSLLVIETRDQGATEPLDHPPARRLRHCLFGLDRTVDDDEVGSPPRERAADGSGVAAAAGGGDELGAGILCGAHGREEGPIPRRID